MNLITSLLLLAFSVLYLGQDSKNKNIKDVTKYLNSKRDSIGYWGFLYGVVAGLISIFMLFTVVTGSSFALAMFAANALLVLLAAPFAYPNIRKHIKVKDSKIDSCMQKIIKITDGYGVILAGIAAIISVASIISVFIRF